MAHMRDLSSDLDPGAAEIGHVHHLVQPHIHSFDWLLHHGLDLIVKYLDPVDIPANPESNRPPCRLSVKQIRISQPSKSDQGLDSRLFPNECREGHTSYTGALTITISRQINQIAHTDLIVSSGQTPIMVKSRACHLRYLDQERLIEHREEATEKGGYFVINGLEKLLRLLILPKRNYIMGISRSSFTNRGALYSDLATSIRCVRPDQSGQTLTCHYINDGSCTLRCTINKQEFLTPVVLIFHALIETTDYEIFQSVCSADDSFSSDRMERMLRECKCLNLKTKSQYRAYLGSRFRAVLKLNDDVSDAEAGSILLRRHFFVHCERSAQKFDVLALMIKKLFALVQGLIQPDNADALSAHEVLLPGFLYANLLKERVQELLYIMKSKIIRDDSVKNPKLSLTDDHYLRHIASQCPEIGQRLRHLITTGNLISSSGLDLQQVSGYAIIAEKLNYYRYMAHFRSIHRGAFFAEMKTTTVRKLLPECFGFLCPVHTPDGSPCGLLNHLTGPCRVICLPDQDQDQDQGRSQFIDQLIELGMITYRAHDRRPIHHGHLPILYNGVLIGFAPVHDSIQLANKLRYLKVTDPKSFSIPKTLEIVLIPGYESGSYPGLYLFSNLGRFIRPVTYLPTKQTEWISPLEQVFLNIAIERSDLIAGHTQHMEIDPVNMLSVIASLTPFSDFNQSPRNMYQCQMGKQTMGTPYHSHPHRADNKIYRIQNLQTPVVRNKLYDKLDMDEYPLGCNAIVAVVSYTGYDMEDAMIINKSAFERGFGHGSVYTTKFIDLSDLNVGNKASPYIFGNMDPVSKELIYQGLGPDGLPPIGSVIGYGDPLYSYINTTTQKPTCVKHKSTEICRVDQIRIIGRQRVTGSPFAMAITLRYNRNAVLGDKFSSRHGQKGVLSQLWNQVDMPFTGDGLTPDVIINPHAFPSRMTIGMLIESMAGKAACLHGIFADGTPFQFNEDDLAVDYFGAQLRAAGYNYLGNEEMYSGVSGMQFHADVFIGVVYYQRLRHMVSDKSQVRSTGPTNEITHQPVQGRKRGGGIRFGEMERDSLLGHGAAYLLNDRLLKCSDHHRVNVCKQCGSIISAICEGNKTICTSCKVSSSCVQITIPYVFTFLVNELAAMNVRVKLNVK